MSSDRVSRRRFLALTAGLAGGLALVPRPVGAAFAGGAVRPRGRGIHPEPRPGITAARVLAGDAVPAKLAELYDGVRAIPQIIDGIGCHCGCAEVEGYYSLLTCYEQEGMALHCDICQEEGALATRMHAQGSTLDEIRAAIDRRFG